MKKTIAISEAPPRYIGEEKASATRRYISSLGQKKGKPSSAYKSILETDGEEHECSASYFDYGGRDKNMTSYNRHSKKIEAAASSAAINLSFEPEERDEHVLESETY